MYDELIKNLRICSKVETEPHCNGCTLNTHDVFCCYRLLNKAADAIEDLITALTASNEVIAKNKPKWIPVTKRLPEDDGEVLCINDYHFYIVGWLYCDDAGKYICESDNEIMNDVTHWMPLPEPPEVET